jgi:hypothetical protein
MPNDVANNELMDTARSSCKTGTLMHGEGNIGSCGGGEIVQQADERSIIPIVFLRRAIFISSKNHSRWSDVFRKLILKATGSDDFVDEAWLSQFSMTFRCMMNINTKVCSNGALRSKDKVFLKSGNNSG